MIANDINGDGMLNDRAFIANPSSIADPTSRPRCNRCSTTRRRLCATVSADNSTRWPRAEAARPVVRQRVSCVKFNPQKIGLPKRASLTLTMSNPLALADLALHGSNDLRGWGEHMPPDQNLLFVRGFDPTTRQFTYDVNQRFGSTRPQQSSTYALPYVSLGLTIDVGVPRERQAAHAAARMRARGLEQRPAHARRGSACRAFRIRCI